MIRFELIRFVKKRWMLLLVLVLFLVDCFLMWVTIEDHEKDRWWIVKGDDYVYSEYIDSVLQNCSRLLNNTELGEITEFRRNNVQHMLDKYTKLKDIEVTDDVTDGIELSTGESWQLILQLILVVLLTLSVFLTDKGCQEMEIATKKGRKQLLFARLFLTWGLAALGTCVLYGLNLILTWKRIGFGDLSAPIQSIEAFQACPYRINGYQYLCLILLIRVVASCLYASIFALIIKLSGSLILGIVLNLVVVFGTYAGFTYINDASIVVHIRYASIWTILNGKTFFQNYLCLPFGNFAIPYLYWTCLCAIVFCFGVLITLWFLGYKALVSLRIVLPRFHFRNSQCRTILGTEIYKLFIANRGILLVLCTVLLIGLFNSRDAFWMDESEQYYRSYMLQYEGELTEAKEREIRAEWERLEHIEDEMQALTERYLNGEIDEYGYQFEMDLYGRQMTMRSAFSRVMENVESVKKHPNTVLVYDTGIRKYLYEDNLTKRVYFLFGGLMIAFFCGGLFASEKEQGTSELLRSTKRGRVEPRRAKIMLGTVLAMAVTISLTVMELVRIAGSFRIPRLTQVPGNGFDQEYFYKVPLLVIVSILILIKVLISQLFAGIILYVSGKSGRTYIAVVTGLIMLTIGLVLKQFGFGIAGFAF